MLRSNANSADLDQISLQSAISEPELHYLHLRNALYSSYKQCKTYIYAAFCDIILGFILVARLGLYRNVYAI